MAVFKLTTFAGTTIGTANICQQSISDTKPVVVRMGYLENGTKFDADGTADADKMLGQVRARFLIVPTSGGVRALNGNINILEGLRGKSGTLSGLQEGANDLTLSCVARCVDVLTEEHIAGQQPVLNKTSKQFAFVTVTWEKKTEWEVTGGSGTTAET